MARKSQKTWQRSLRPPRPPAVDDAEKQAIIHACEAFIRDVLKPRFLPEIRPTEWNYPIDIHGDWRGGRYRFLQRYRSGMADNLGEDFDAPFARLDRVGPDQFDIQWMRHTGTWWRLHSGVTLAQALKLLETDGHLHPV
ncbi:hypothetical protein BJF92_11045 [Rhizobium rhizosphaerae]|uniref:Uncharacterized protein n=1 Tax=Xaviernesmea rhizosphaerae TaxID=1672749 RepID=A0A1Q9AMK5_9HYPH|nr:hypothetical protein [Xaviernesmea rhizosphaerae]OLP56621.1 hypothetical protein BJF92_11045 [Xaviernesmea rhizosphaerae]